MGTNGAHLSCRQVVELVSDYLEGALPSAQAARFEAHIAMCDGCAAYLEQMRETIRLAGELPEESVPTSTWNVLLAAFRDWKHSGPTSAA
jgi:anti-sigma factor RsiW